MVEGRTVARARLGARTMNHDAAWAWMAKYIRGSRLVRSLLGLNGRRASVVDYVPMVMMNYNYPDVLFADARIADSIMPSFLEVDCSLSMAHRIMYEADENGG